MPELAITVLLVVTLAVSVGYLGWALDRHIGKVEAGSAGRARRGDRRFPLSFYIALLLVANAVFASMPSS